MSVILVLEDNHETRDMLHPMLEGAGYEVLSVAGGRRAIDLINGPVQIDLLFSDIHLPDIDGFEVAAYARKHRPGLPVLFATGDPAICAGNELDDIPILKKPYGMAQLLDAVNKAFAQSDGAHKIQRR